jgi:hypothetical protein
LKAPGVHLVLDRSDVFGGPASNAVVFGTRKFYDANPKTIAAFMAALRCMASREPKARSDPRIADDPQWPIRGLFRPPLACLGGTSITMLRAIESKGLFTRAREA